jgi:hypothetical protein
VSPVYPTPIYDQLRGERINAEIPASDPTAAESTFRRSPRAATGRTPSWSWFTAPDPAVQPAINTTGSADPLREAPPRGQTHSTSQPTGRDHGTSSATWGPRAVPPPAHARHERVPPASGAPRPAAGHSPAAPGAAAAGHDAHRGPGQRPRQAGRAESRSAAPVGAVAQQ